ncbi:class I SAM-dependent methyltransferase, partial [Campylobacter lari]|nr:class I SAM-dependent methyltransferase [Campylobacter lari]
ILHIGPARCIYDKLKKINKINYITSDPFSDSMYKYKLENIPFADGYFDFIICIAVLMHVLDDDKCLEEMYRLLSTKGKLILWVGDLYNNATIERYNRGDYSRMKAIDFSCPEDLSDGKVIELDDGSLGYNPMYSTRTYGKDFLCKLRYMGFKVDTFISQEFPNYERYGLVKDDILILCEK